MSIYLSICIYLCLSVCPSVCQSLCVRARACRRGVNAPIDAVGCHQSPSGDPTRARSSGAIIALSLSPALCFFFFFSPSSLPSSFSLFSYFSAEKRMVLTGRRSTLKAEKWKSAREGKHTDTYLYMVEQKYLRGLWFNCFTALGSGMKTTCFLFFVGTS